MDTLTRIDEIKKAILEEPGWTPAQIPWRTINRLTQVRQTFEDIDGLAEDLAHHGQLNELLVAVWTSEQAEDYIRAVNKVHKVKHSLADLKPVNLKGDVRYYVMIDGERRWRATERLAEHGCDECRELPDFTAPCIHYQTRFFRDKMRVKVYEGISVSKAINLQLSANIHSHVPIEQESVAYAQLFNFRREEDPTLTKRKFANSVGRSVDYVADALRFEAVPDWLRAYYDKHVITYGMVIQLQRLVEMRIARKDIEYKFIKRIATEHWDGARCQKEVSWHIALQQQVILDLLLTEESTGSGPVIERRLIRSILEGKEYFRQLRVLIEGGVIDSSDSPYAPKALAMLYVMVEEFRQMTPIVRQLTEDPSHLRFLRRTPAKLARALLDMACTAAADHRVLDGLDILPDDFATFMSVFKKLSAKADVL